MDFQLKKKMEDKKEPKKKPREMVAKRGIK